MDLFDRFWAYACEQSEKEKRQRGECRNPYCDNKKHPNRATCDECMCHNPKCTRGYTENGKAFCGRCSPKCEIKDCKFPPINTLGEHTRCYKHRPLTCQVCNVDTMGLPLCEEHRCVYISVWNDRCTARVAFSDHRCQSHTRVGCRKTDCKAVSLNGSHYCAIHKCLKCDECCKFDSSYCEDHNCITWGCKKPHLDGKETCEDHTCRCGQRSRYPSGSCDKCKCIHCQEFSLPEDKVCEKHLQTCRLCSNSALPRSKFCLEHRCHSKFCLNGFRCSEHNCLKCKRRKDDDYRFCEVCRCPVLSCDNARSKHPDGMCGRCRKESEKLPLPPE